MTAFPVPTIAMGCEPVTLNVTPLAMLMSVKSNWATLPPVVATARPWKLVPGQEKVMALVSIVTAAPAGMLSGPRLPFDVKGSNVLIPKQSFPE